MARKSPELEAHKAIIGFLEKALSTSVRAIHIPNGGKRDARTGAMLKALGTKAGVPDITLIRQGGAVAFTEVKASKGAISPAQSEWRDWFGFNAVPYAVCRSVCDVQSVLVDWNIPMKAQVAA